MSIQVFWPIGYSSEIEEVEFSYRFCRNITRKQLKGVVWHDYLPGKPLPSSSGEYLLLVKDPQVIVSRMALNKMLRTLKEDSDAVAAVPVYNVTSSEEQVADLPVNYTTITTFLEVSELLALHPYKPMLLKSAHDTGCILYRCDRHVNADVPVVVCKGALVHRFCGYASQPRPDLWGLVPLSARTILDVGCGGGAFGRWLKQEKRYPHSIVVGIEPNPVLAQQAMPFYHEVHTVSIESFSSSMKQNQFDFILCGDVLEHTINPWRVLSSLRNLLSQKGSMLISIPNVGHWSVIMDQARGRWDYIPYGLKCVTHLRWFTEDSIAHLFEDSGMRIEHVIRNQMPATPLGERLIRMLVDSGFGNEKSLRTHELVFVLRRR
ncbi:hypothetical protein MIN45_P0342 [Methylomarinovum tepidoasis]|uniref:Uncharacterized protein n=1 Tax=Methylomarinovum tepidoasis TaxID=2840183 RepID=A0AAU9C6H6_9GAMM|nr:class I SAM-dependent methyltransferase [Methylomarinovum sp. IN45]BCX87975.1 hypothetical protein MIN45_P0342 [Methylomarinovum sp. IN45]